MLKQTWKKFSNRLMPQPLAVEGGEFLPELSLQQLIGWQRYQSALGAHLKTQSRSSLAGQHRSRIQGRGMELSEIRNYQPGDDIRLMDWKVTARTRKPHTKVFLEEKERPVHLVVDMSHSMLFGSERSKAEQAANIAATLGWSCLSQGDRCGGLVFNGSHYQLIQPKARQKGLLPLLQALCQYGKALDSDIDQENPSPLSAQLSQAQPGRMNQVLQQMAAQSGHGNLVVIISDFWSLDLTDFSVLRQISKRHNLLAIQVSDPLEYELPEGPCNLTDGRQQVFFDGDKPQDQSRYRKGYEQRQQALQQALLKSGGQLISLSTREHPAEVLKQYFA
ncbi:MAG: hypothetical protein CMI12_02430 [Oceanospirillum sp.]|nr:hypothetical protein [Oceanospirillum sp.]